MTHEHFLVLFLFQFATLLAVIAGIAAVCSRQRALQRNQHEYIAQALRKERERLLIENAP